MEYRIKVLDPVKLTQNELVKSPANNLKNKLGVRANGINTEPSSLNQTKLRFTENISIAENSPQNISNSYPEASNFSDDSNSSEISTKSSMSNLIIEEFDNV